MSSRFDVTVWYLQMHDAPARSETVRPEGASVVRVMSPSTHFYRYLYETVGAPWLWVERRRIPDEELAAIISDDDVHLYVAYVDGAPAGYFELDARRPLEVEIAYFGLMPEQIGKGLGRWMMHECLARAWGLTDIARVWVHTCSLDHPRALGNYEAAGMVRYDVREETVWDPRPLPISPR